MPNRRLAYAVLNLHLAVRQLYDLFALLAVTYHRTLARRAGLGTDIA